MTARMFSRRSFLGTTAAVPVVLASRSAAMSRNHRPLTERVGVQLYTLRSIMQDDFAGVVRKVGTMGYDAVEFAGTGGLTATQMAALLGDAGLICCGSHDGYDTLTPQALPATIEYAKQIGNQFITCPSMPGEFRENGAEGYRAFADQMNRIGEAVTAAGITFCYHNHSFEFEQATDGTTFMDILIERTDPTLVQFEVDTAWVYSAGVDPVAFIEKNAGRCPLLHIKDQLDERGMQQVPVGDGIVPIPAILKAGKATGADWYIVEQDRTTRPPLEAIEISLRNIKSLLAAT